jgi:AcrR family transcriptional regulator
VTSNTRADILKIADGLIRHRGYNAFSFSDISTKLNIKNASVHYHFPTKTRLAVALVKEHIESLHKLIEKSAALNPIEKLHAFFSIYSSAKSQQNICIVGSFATDLYTVDKEVENELKKLVNNILSFVVAILDEGKKKKVFYFKEATRTKALMIITNMMAAVQLTRLTNQGDFEDIRHNIINDLTSKK